MKKLFLILAGITGAIIIGLMIYDLSQIEDYSHNLEISQKYDMPRYAYDNTPGRNSYLEEKVISKHIKLLAFTVLPLILIAFLNDIFKSTSKGVGQVTRTIKDGFDEGMKKEQNK